MDKKTVNINDHLSIEIEKQLDQYPDLSFYGEFSNNVREWCVDRKMGKLFGENAPEPMKSERLNELEIKHDNFYWYHEPDQVFEEKEEYERLYEEYEKAYAFWDEHYGFKVVADVGCNYDHNSYRFFHINTDGFSDETEEDKIKYATQTWELVYGIIQGHWWYETWQVTIYVDGIEISSDVLGGIESDMSKEGNWQMLEDMISNAYHDFATKISDEVVSMQKKISTLELAHANLPTMDSLLETIKAEL